MQFPEFKKGSVWLAGAGPGDARLLTLFAAHGIANADVIMHDALVCDEALSLANKSAVIEFAGKRAGQKSLLQDEINARMIAHANAGARVLRLKGGDPFVFARGGEEAVALANAGIKFRIIAGITSGLSALSCASIPATNRKTNNVVSLVTGRDLTKCLPSEINWQALADSSPVIIFYMAMLTISEITTSLIKAGRGKDEPCVIISKAYMRDQKIKTTTLENAAQDMASMGRCSPVIFAIGDVVKIRQTIKNWHDDC